jgi:hypothetical protein
MANRHPCQKIPRGGGGALAIQRNPDSTATVFTVTRTCTGESRIVDTLDNTPPPAIGGSPNPKPSGPDWILDFVNGAEDELIADGFPPADAQAIAIQAGSIVREHED